MPRGVPPYFFDSWEDGTFSKWSTILGNPYTIITSPVKCGNRAIRSNLSVGEIYHVLQATPKVQHFQFFFRIIPNPDEPPAGGSSQILFKVSLVGGFDIDLYVVTGGTPSPQLGLATWGGGWSAGATIINSNHWYCIELRIVADTVGATHKVYLDGDLEISLSKDTSGKQFYRAYFEAVQWTAGMDCRSAIDCYSYYDEDTYLNCHCDECTASGGGPNGTTFTFEIGGVSSIGNNCVVSIHYVKSHPNPDPDTFEIRLLPECGETIRFFDKVEIKKRGVTEYFGFVEEITPEVGDNGLEYLITGRCWKLIAWKKWNERFQESREVGPEDVEGTIETGFFGSVRPDELVKFLVRVPISEHPKGYIRQKVGWGIPSDFWTYCPSCTADCYYPDWVGLRYTGLAWRNRGSFSQSIVEQLDVNGFTNQSTDKWTTSDGSDCGAGDGWGGPNTPWIDSDDESNYICIYVDPPVSAEEVRYFSFANLATIVNPYRVELCVKRANPYSFGYVDVYIWDGSWQFVGNINYGYGTPDTKCFDVSGYLNSISKINNARVKFITGVEYDTFFRFYIYHAYLKVEGWTSYAADQQIDDYFIVDLGTMHDDVTAMMVECRSNPSMYPRAYHIQWAPSNCCLDEVEVSDNWRDFDPIAEEWHNETRDVLESWTPQDGVRCIRIKILSSCTTPWEISQIYVWKADEERYKMVDEDYLEAEL